MADTGPTNPSADPRDLSSSCMPLSRVFNPNKTKPEKERKERNTERKKEGRKEESKEERNTERKRKRQTKKTGRKNTEINNNPYS